MDPTAMAIMAVNCTVKRREVTYNYILRIPTLIFCTIIYPHFCIPLRCRYMFPRTSTPSYRPLSCRLSFTSTRETASVTVSHKTGPTQSLQKCRRETQNEQASTNSLSESLQEDKDLVRFNREKYLRVRFFRNSSDRDWRFSRLRAVQVGCACGGDEAFC